MSDRIHGRDRLVELYGDRAVFGLDPEQERELARLQGGDQTGSWNEAEELEQAAAAIAMLFASRQIQPLPSELCARLEGGARAYFVAHTESARPHRSTPVGVAPTLAPAPPIESPTLGSRRLESVRPASRWPLAALAAAASVAAIVGWWPRPVETPAPQVAVTPAPAELRSKLLGEAGTLFVAAQGTDFAKGASGDVVWQPLAQSGWMRLVGLPVNDPKVEQYQLWIFDEAQKHPVDGGVFNVSANGELLVPIDAKLRVEKPTLFAITIEKPGGVVVSDRERIAWVAKPI
ncbi:MAG: anti-sigma factor [Planctomycetes bacterium]|nr:anti-sigma factor [Planctomycetota bacterium]